MINHQDRSEKQNCMECGKELFGRTDKRFCNDTCRNSFNRKIRAEEKSRDNENIPGIFKQIRTNYEILKQYHLEKLEEGTTIHITKQELLGKGFEPKFCTSVLNKGYNELWLFCFEFGYKKEGERHFELCFDPIQAK